MNLKELFEKHDGEYGHFERVQNKLSDKPDLHAFLLLNKTCQSTKGDLITAAEHDKIWLGTLIASFETNATEEIVVELIRCGVMFDDQFQSFSMFV